MRDDAVLGRALPLDRGLGPVSTRQIHSVDELKRRLIDVWYGIEQSIF